MAEDFISGMLSGQQFQLNKFLIQEAPIKLEKEKLALQISKQDYTRHEQMATLLAKNADKIPPGQNPMDNAANTFIEMGNAAVKSGLPEEASKDFAQAGKFMSMQSNAAYKRWQEVYQQTKYADQLLSTIPPGVSQEEGQRQLDQINAHIKMTTGKPSALEGQRYSPQLVEDLRKATLTKRTAAQEEYTRALARKADADAKVDAEKPALIKSQVELNTARAEAARKHGVDNLQAKPAMVSATAAALISDSNDTMSSSTARTLAEDIALDAQSRMDKQGKTKEQAIHDALENAKAHGVLAGIPPPHSRPGTSAKKPLPLPADPTQFKPQMWYQAPDGPRWYDPETESLYRAGEGPGDEEEAGGEDDK